MNLLRWFCEKIFYSLSDPAEIILFQLFDFADRNPFPVAKQGIIFFRHLQQLLPGVAAIWDGRAAASGAIFVFYGPNVHRLSSLWLADLFGLLSKPIILCQDIFARMLKIFLLDVISGADCSAPETCD